MTTNAYNSLKSQIGFSDAGTTDVSIIREDPILPSRFAIANASSAALAACGAAAATLWTERGGAKQAVEVDAVGATATLLGFMLQNLDAEQTPERIDQPTSQIYATKDGRWVHTHGGFPHLAQGILNILQCDENKESIAAAVANWNAQDLEDEIAKRNLCGAMLRTWDEWLAHPQGQAIADAPPVEILKIGDSDPVPFKEGDRPLSGVRCLDLTRVLAGPTCARTLASHGTEVLKVNNKDLPSIPAFVIETGHGKRSTHLNLKEQHDLKKLQDLIEKADVFSQGYRSGALARLGLTPQALAEKKPGIIYVSINCYGHEGPWAERGGWEQLAQSVTGQAITEGGPEGPPRLIAAAANDYTTGYLAALGVLEALRRRAKEGGSYHVRASLCQTAMWMTRLGLVDDEPSEAGDLQSLLAPFMTESQSGFGKLTHLGPIVRMGETMPRWEQPTVPLGTHDPEWRS